MTQAEKDAATLMLDEAETAVIKALARVEADTGIDMLYEASILVDVFDNIRQKIEKAE